MYVFIESFIKFV